MDRVRIGVIGGGAIAQVHHLPLLNDLSEEFEIKVVCDLSPALSKHVAERFHVPSHESDYRAVLDSDVDAVLLCHTDPKTEVAVAAFLEGRIGYLDIYATVARVCEAHSNIAKPDLEQVLAADRWARERAGQS